VGSPAARTPGVDSPEIARSGSTRHASGLRAHPFFAITDFQHVSVEHRKLSARLHDSA
jgi:hypothetical protein